MRIASFVFGLLGAVASLLLGVKWFGDLNSETGKAAIKLANTIKGPDAGAFGEILSMQRGTYALLACGVIGLAVSVMVLIRKGNKMANAILLIVCGILPLMFAGKAVFGVPMALAGLLALGIKAKKNLQP
jgi:hypothetical protein